MTPQDLDDVGVRWTAAMRRGDFEAAWQETDRIELDRRHLQLGGRFTPQPHYLVWDGTPFRGRDVLVRCTHGLGDTLQFVRYVPRVCALARTVTLLVQPHFLPLFERAAEFGHVRNGWTDERPPPHDVEIEVMELPYAFRSTVTTLPRTVPYVPVERLIDRAVSTSVDQADHGLKVGLLWAASEWDVSRSLPLSALVPLARAEGVHFYSLQQGKAAEDWARLPVPVEPLHRSTGEIIDAAAAMLRLDVVITIDGMAAHLAGALGRPVWVLLKHEADWRWMSGRADSPWYPTMRLFRQPDPGNWVAVLERVALELQEVCARGALNNAARPYR